MGLFGYLWGGGSFPQSIGWILFGWPFAIPILLVTGAVWKRAQSDYPLFARYQAARAQYRRDLSEWQRTQTQWLRTLSGTGFEAEVARVFQRRGYTVQRLGGAGDQGVDLILNKDGKSIIAQCKAHKTPVGPSVVRDLYGTLLHYQRGEAWLFSTSGFTVGAKKFAAGKPILLLSVEDILREVIDPRGPKGK
jgi:restriction system protein